MYMHIILYCYTVALNVGRTAIAPWITLKITKKSLHPSILDKFCTPLGVKKKTTFQLQGGGCMYVSTAASPDPALTILC